MEKDAISEEPIEFVLKDFPGTRYYPKFHLTTWHPRGILDPALAEKVINIAHSMTAIPRMIPPLAARNRGVLDSVGNAAAFRCALT